MFALTPIVFVLLAVVGGGAAAIGNSHQPADNSTISGFEACVEAQAIDAELQTQNPDQPVLAECDSTYEPEAQAALKQ